MPVTSLKQLSYTPNIRSGQKCDYSLRARVSVSETVWHGPQPAVTYEILELGDLLLQDVRAHFVVFNHAVDLQFLDAVAHWHQFGGAPQEPVHLHRAHALLQFRHVRLIVPLKKKQKNIKERVLQPAEGNMAAGYAQASRPARWTIWR